MGLKYSCETIINLPLEKTAKLWNDSKFFKEWQDGFEKIELLSGIENTKGAVSMIYFSGKQEMELKESIISIDLPHEKIGLYEHKHMTNTQKTNFEKINETQTRFISEVEYLQFNGIMIKLMARIFPGMFQKQSQKWMEQFRAFVEGRNG